ncbi:hypothetical protein [Tepiditoga spiralis]|nr:hypothetical protein [Tepiditoga spiralis]
MNSFISLFRLIIISIIMFNLNYIIGFSTFFIITVSFFIFKYANNYYLKNISNVEKGYMIYFDDTEDTINGKIEIINYFAFNKENKRNYTLYDKIKRKKSYEILFNLKMMKS